MKRKLLTTLVAAGVMAGSMATAFAAQPPKMKMTTDIPASVTAPDKVKTSIGTLKYFDGVPTAKTVETVYDYLDRSRAVNVYINSIPALSVNALREGQAAAGCVTSNQICIWDNLMNSTTVLLTGNTSTMYAVGFLDLVKDGPTVITNRGQTTIISDRKPWSVPNGTYLRWFVGLRYANPTYRIKAVLAIRRLG